MRVLRGLRVLHVFRVLHVLVVLRACVRNEKGAAENKRRVLGATNTTTPEVLFGGCFGHITLGAGKIAM